MQMTTPENRALYGEQILPGEDWSNFLERTGLYKKLTRQQMSEAEDAFKVQSLARDEETKSRGIITEQSDIAKKRLNDLASLLATNEDKQFNLDIPGIAESAQAKGMLETSGFGKELANHRAQLTATTQAELAKQALSDRDIEIAGLGDIGKQTNALTTAGLERTFSNEDLTRSEALARELAKYGVAAPAKEPSTMDKALMYGGPLLSGVAAVGGK